jgi:hypothetical protein
LIARVGRPKDLAAAKDIASVIAKRAVGCFPHPFAQDPLQLQ